MKIIRFGSLYAVRNTRGRIIFQGTEKECHQYCQEVVATASFQEV